VLAEMPRMMREIVENIIGAESDMQVVGVAESDDALADAVARTRADVLILALDADGELRAYDALLFRHPRLHVLAVTEDGRGALISELRPHHVPLADVSPAGLVDAIRASARAEAR
jgi:DNA-binding NarL/FixJ family response regulator